MSDSAELLSDKTLKRLGTIFIELYVEEIDKFLEKDEKERERKRSVYMQKRKAQGLMTIEQVAEWAPQYSLEIQRTIRYIGMKIIDEDKSTCDFENMGAMLCKPSQVPSHLLHLR